MSYKEKLDEVATKTKQSNQNDNNGGLVNQVVEKVSQYIPAIQNVFPTGKKEEEVTYQKTPGPPERPHHDVQIEEFLRDQHRSKNNDASPMED